VNKSDYAFGSGAPPATETRQTVKSYWGNTNRVTDVQIHDSSNAKVAETQITMDSTALTSVTGATHHDDANYGTAFSSRGNPTVIGQWVGGSNYLNTTLYYDTTSQLTKSVDSDNHTTYFSSNDMYFNDTGTNPPQTYSPSIKTNAFITAVTLPISGSLSIGYYFGTGASASATDQNSNTFYAHYDDLGRVSATSQPDGGCTSTTYTSNTVWDSYTCVTSGASRHDQLDLDNWGRTSSQILVNDPDGQTNVDSAYDSSGRLSSVSDPYRGTSPGGERYYYDGLNRIIQVIHADGSVPHTYYGADVANHSGLSSQVCPSTTYGLGYPVLYRDESADLWQYWYDSLGRLIEVDEPNATGSINLATFNYPQVWPH
jgi:YD repeat-containing protein